MSLFDLVDGRGTAPATAGDHHHRHPVPTLSSTAPPPPPLQKMAVGFAPTAGSMSGASSQPLAAVPASSSGPLRASSRPRLDSPFLLLAVDVESRSSAPPVPVAGPGTTAVQAPVAQWLALAVANNVLILSQRSPPKVLRIFLDGQRDTDEIELELPKKMPSPCLIRSIFLDPTGQHCLLSTNDDLGLFYLSARSKRARYLTKLKGVIPTAVAWNRSQPVPSAAPAGAAANASTGSILLGTLESTLWELVLEPVDDASGGFFSLARPADPLKFAKSIGTVTHPATNNTGSGAGSMHDSAVFLNLDHFPADDHKGILYAATRSGQLLQYIASLGAVDGAPGSLDRLVAHKPWAHVLPPLAACKRPPANTSDPTPLAPVSMSHPVFPGGILGAPTKLTWLTASGIYAAPIAMGSQVSGDCVFDHPQLFHLPPPVDASSLVAVIALEFHYVLVARNHIWVLSSLVSERSDASDAAAVSPSQQHGGPVAAAALDSDEPALRIVWDQPVPSPVLGVSQDQLQKTIWVISSDQLFELQVVDEGRDIWQFYLNEHRFEEALKYCRTKDQRDLVIRRQAEFYFNSNRFVLSAKYFAQAPSAPFEEVTLRFIEREELEALRVYLNLALEATSNRAKPDDVQMTMLSTWLLELHLEHLNDLHPNEEEQRLLENSVREFMKKYHGHLDKSTVRQLCTSYNRPAELIHFFQTTRDYASLMHHWIEHREWESAITILERQVDPAMFYRFVPLLLEHAPARIVQLLAAHTRDLNVGRLIGSFLKSSSAAVQKHALAFFEHLVTRQGNTDTVVHNYLVQLYSKQALEETSGAAATALLAFLQASPRYYTLDHALRVCHGAGQMEAMIYLLTERERVHDAIRLALLRGDVDHAEAMAQSSVGGGDEVRAYWMAIVGYLVEKKQLGRAIRMVRKSRAIRLEDVLGKFPEVETMDAFRDDLVDVLQNYSAEQEDLEASMDSAFASLERLRVRVTNARSAQVAFDLSDPCPTCNQVLDSRGGASGWIAFLCGHVVHNAPMCAPSGKADCPVCGDCLPVLLETPIVDANDIARWAI
ncbi:hypothetical protein BC828DRAFT_412683 [Blastocladiella britannica]|nr:hypothetical protein BC828DRAFT_412683 [Blastocladiella britannica]